MEVVWSKSRVMGDLEEARGCVERGRNSFRSELKAGRSKSSCAPQRKNTGTYPEQRTHSQGERERERDLFSRLLLPWVAAGRSFSLLFWLELSGPLKGKKNRRTRKKIRGKEERRKKKSLSLSLSICGHSLRFFGGRRDFPQLS